MAYETRSGRDRMKGMANMWTGLAAIVLLGGTPDRPAQRGA
ncbi:hypothetical protein [Paracoccus sp. 1_MG-2023]|nr:hypothetical protein [Paracoccus sp. 1_MG-2023]